MDYNFKTHQYGSCKTGSDASKWDLNCLTFKFQLFKDICLTQCINCEKKSGQIMCTAHDIFSCFCTLVTTVKKLASQQGVKE